MLDALVQLDRLRITVIVDNETDGLSPPCGCCQSAQPAAAYTSEVSRIVSEVTAGSRQDLDFRAICNAGHGYSLLLEAETGDGTTHRCVVVRVCRGAGMSGATRCPRSSPAASGVATSCLHSVRAVCAAQVAVRWWS
jgi:hypothetical protein